MKDDEGRIRNYKRKGCEGGRIFTIDKYVIDKDLIPSLFSVLISRDSFVVIMNMDILR